MIDIRWDRPSDQQAIRAFLERVGFVVRPPETWQALGMSAATAWRDGRLLGAIPLEPRRLKIGAERCLHSLQQTTVAVDPALRGQGLGSAMQDFIAMNADDKAEAASVFREEPESPGYRWYRTNGFRPIQRLDIWTRAAVVTPSPSTLRLESWTDPAVPLATIEALRQRRSATGCGLYIPREDRPLASWLPVHPYASARRFEIAWSERPFGYILLGRSDTGQLDLLEIEQEETIGDSLEALLGALLSSIARREGTQLRCMLAGSDKEAAAALQAVGFERSTSMDLLIKPLAQALALEIPDGDRAKWRHHAIDYV